MSSIRILKTLLAAARYGTFAATGNKLGLTPAAVGQQIKILEHELNCQLFIRVGRTVKLSPEGRARLPKIAAIVEAYEALIHVDDGSELTGQVAVGALVSALMGAFASALRTIRYRHANLHVTLYAGMSSDFAHKVLMGELDAAIVTNSPEPWDPALLWTPLYTEPLVLIAPRLSVQRTARKQTVQGILASHLFLQFQPQTWTGRLVQQALVEKRITLSETMELNSIETIVELVRQGIGASIVPKLASVNWSEDKLLQVVPLDDIHVVRQVGLLERRTHGRTRFTREIKEYFGIHEDGSD